MRMISFKMLPISILRKGSRTSREVLEHSQKTDRRLGGVSPPLGRPPATGKSFRFVRACDARCLDVKRNPDAKRTRAAFPFSLLAPGSFPFSLFA